MEKQSVLITGTGGFIGAHVVRKFLAKNQYRVIAISRKGFHYSLSNHDLMWIQGSFLVPELLEKVFSSHAIQSVIHLAALRGAGSGDEKEYQSVNVEGTERLLEASLKHKVKKFIFCSSVGVYGTIPSEVPATLKTPVNGDNLYHTSKILAEEKVQQFIKHGLNAYIIRPTISYGAGDTGFPRTLVELVRTKRFLLSSGDMKIHLLNVSGFAELLHTMLRKQVGGRQRTYIAADAEPIPLRDLVNVIHQHYYGTNYPSFLQMPNFIFKGLQMTFRMLQNEKWLTRILLISKSWHYEIRETVQYCSYKPTKTAETFIEEMQL
ncbi:MAG: NAD(P)-dependent oxidoreductase [bacterium]|nr:NAD(P)-dependent oxidoreductase [bacterium]